MQTNIEITFPPNSIAGQIIKALEQGPVTGTVTLYDQIDGSERMVKYYLRKLRERGIVRSSHPIGDRGRGHKAIHKLSRSIHSHGGRRPR